MIHNSYRWFLCVLIVLLTGCLPNNEAHNQEKAELIEKSNALEPMKMTFMPGYRPQANLPFVGAYVAEKKGFFKEQNLEVTITHSPGRGEHLQLVTAGKVQVTTQDAAVMLQRRADPGLPLVSIALLGQRGQQAFAALKKSGMVSPRDWEGKTVGYKGTPPPELTALILAAGANPNKMSLINVGFDPRLLTEGKVDVYPVFKSNEPYLIKSWGYELVLWEPEDYGVPSLGLTYTTSEATLAQNPEMLARFLSACLKGIEYAHQNLDDAVSITLEYTGPETSREHMRFMLESELKDAESSLTRQKGLGWQSLEQWQALADMLQRQNALASIDAGKAFSNQVLELAQKKMQVSR
jgi:ABC-type nitrate/sulfonate/bicarbonate transport system substrate-binding protein